MNNSLCIMRQFKAYYPILPLLTAFLGLALLLYKAASFSAEELRFFLQPTSIILGIIIGQDFTFIAGEGYLDNSGTILLAAECSGLRFFICAAVSALSSISAPQNLKASLLQTCAILFSVYLTTLGANTARITLTLLASSFLRSFQTELSRQAHEGIGAFVYFTFLIILTLFLRAAAYGREKYRA